MQKKVQGIGFALLLGAAVSAQAADMFLVIGQSVGRWRSEVPATFTVPAIARSGQGMELLGQIDGTALGGEQACVDGCSLHSLQYGVVPSFANTWRSLSKEPAHYVIRGKPGSALTAAGNTQGNGYWTDFDSEKKGGLYRATLNDFVAAHALAAASKWKVGKRYILWLQGEQDAAAGVSAAAYKSKLSELLARFNADLAALPGAPTFDALFLVSTGYFHGADKNSKDSITEHRDKVDAVVRGQDEAAAADPRIVLVSRAPRVFMSACLNGAGTPGCQSRDLATYFTSAYDAMGAEMARNALAYRSSGIKALLDSSCKAQPDSCGATVDVHRWASTGVARPAHANSLDAKVNDSSALQYAGVRFQLFKDPAPGRVALYRRWNAQLGEGFETTKETEGGEAFQTQALLGYCYAKQASNAGSALMRLGLRNDHVTTTSVAEAQALMAQGYASEGTLCYVN